MFSITQSDVYTAVSIVQTIVECKVTSGRLDFGNESSG